MDKDKIIKILSWIIVAIIFIIFVTISIISAYEIRQNNRVIEIEKPIIINDSIVDTLKFKVYLKRIE